MDKELLKTLEDTKTELDKLKQSFASLDEKYKASADMHNDMEDEKMKKMHQMMDERMSYIYQMISSVRDMVYRSQDENYAAWNSHLKSHIPVLTASQMQKMLDNCGAGSDYEIRRPILSVASKNTHRGLEITASFTKK